MPFDLEIKYIEELEKELNAKLPELYRRFISENNGGELE